MSLHSIAEKMAFYMVRKDIFAEEKMEIYTYGFEILFATILNGILVLVASIFLNVFWQTILMLIPFMLLRHNAGGYHAKTHIGCVTSFMAVYLVGIFLMKSIPLNLATNVSIVGIFVSTGVICALGALPTANRPVNAKELTYFKARSRFYAVVLFIVGVVGLAFFKSYFIYFTLGLIIAAGSLLAELIKLKKEREVTKCPKLKN